MTGAVTVRRTADPSEVLVRGAHVLAVREGDHAVIYALCDRLRRNPAPDAYLSLVERAGAVVGCAAGRAGVRIAVSHLDAGDAADAVADDLAAAVPTLARLVAFLPYADRLAGRVAVATGRRATVAMAQRHFEATDVRPPTGVAGRVRDIVAGDRAVVREWVGAFMAEALGEHDPQRAVAVADDWLTRDGEDSGLVVWEDGGLPVAMAGFTGPTPNGITVLSVYTPPALRGRGYASACTAALTGRLLASGRRRVFLSTDLANRTSNELYPRIGFRPLGESRLYRFADA